MSTIVPSMNDPFLTVSEVAGIFAVTPATVRKWLRDGELSGIKLAGDKWRIQQSEITRYANKKYGDGNE